MSTHTCPSPMLSRSRSRFRSQAAATAALFQACRQGDACLVNRALVGGADVNAMKGARTILDELVGAALAGLTGAKTAPAIVGVLATRGLALDRLSSVGQTALIRCAGPRGDAMRRALLDSGASVMACGIQNKTPLHAAAAHGHIHALDDFIVRGASIVAIDSLGLTPMHYLVAGQHAGVPVGPAATQACMDRLLSAGADAALTATALSRGWCEAGGAGWQVFQRILVVRERSKLSRLPQAQVSPTRTARLEAESAYSTAGDCVSVNRQKRGGMIDRKDFVSTVKCASCPRYLSEAYIERTPTGDVAYGSSCARKKFGSLRGVPDLTLHAKVAKGGPKGGPKGSGAGLATSLSNAGAALRYILLREERVAAYRPSISHPQLQPILALYRSQGHLTPAQVTSILSIEASQPVKFRLKNLLDVHAAHHLISAKPATTASAVNFKTGVLNYLHTKLSLTQNHLSVLNLGMPPGAFA